jgi:succinyl-CoA synthetase beta subunit
VWCHQVREQTKELVSKLYDLFIKKDCTLAEINPLVEDHQGQSTPAAS